MIMKAKNGESVANLSTFKKMNKIHQSLDSML
jgi:hypothetical protein